MELTIEKDSKLVLVEDGLDKLHTLEDGTFEQFCLCKCETQCEGYFQTRYFGVSVISGPNGVITVKLEDRHEILQLNQKVLDIQSEYKRDMTEEELEVFFKKVLETLDFIS